MLDLFHILTQKILQGISFHREKKSKEVFCPQRCGKRSPNREQV